MGMPNLARQQQVSELYHAALLLEPPARTPFLQRRCGSDDGLRAEVSSLLACDAAAADFLEQSPSIVANPSPPAASIGSCIGPYQVVAHLGAGGMGEVYRARDARLGRDVALKMLPTSVTTVADRQRRLDREARTLAGLNHPNIAAIYGVEECAGNRALVLELVEGQTLHERIHGSGGDPLGRWSRRSARGACPGRTGNGAGGAWHRRPDRRRPGRRPRTERGPSRPQAGQRDDLLSRRGQGARLRSGAGVPG